MSADADNAAAALQSRRLRLRNAHVHASPLPYSHRRMLSGSNGLSGGRKKPSAVENDDNGWETDSEKPPDLEQFERDGSQSPVNRPGNRMSTGSILSTASTLLNTPERSRARISGSSSPRGHSPPSKSPYMRAYHRRNVSTEGGSVREGRYIEYLERQMAELMGQLQEYTSPTSPSNHATKLRKLTSENRTLRNEISEWETNFNIRVNEEAARRYTGDMSLRGQIKNLELKLEDADEKLRVAKLESQDMRKKLEDLKGVREENRTLEGRLETLSNLLAASASTLRSVPTSNSMADTSASHKRAHSTTSTDFIPASRQKVSPEVFCGIEDFGITDSIPASSPDSADPPRPHSSDGVVSPAVSRTFSRTVPEMPTPSLGARRMRRFPSGSSAPKTLILPSAAAVASPTLSEGRSFFSSPDPNAQSRPTSSSSTITTTSYASQSTLPAYDYRRASLFDELARASDPYATDGEETEKDFGTRRTSMAFPGDAAPEPASPTLAETFSIVTDAVSHPTPLIVKVLTTVGEGITSPTATFCSAKRKAMGILHRVVGKGVDRVAYRRARLFAIKTRERRRAPFANSETPYLSEKLPCSECGNDTYNLPGEFPTGANSLGMDDNLWESATLRRPSTTTTTTSSSTFFTHTNNHNHKPGSPIKHMALQKNSTFEDSLENVWLWVRFVIAIVVALGVAVKDGPGVVLAVDADDYYDGLRDDERENALRRLCERSQGAPGGGWDVDAAVRDRLHRPRPWSE